MTDHEPDSRLFQGLACAGRKTGNPGVTGDPSRIRTCNPRSRNPLLYPVELWDRRFAARGMPVGLDSIANMKNPLPGQARSEPFSEPKRRTLAVDRCVQAAVNAMLRRIGLPLPPKGSLRQMLYATFSHPCSAAISRSPFRASLYVTRTSSAAQGAPS